MLELLYHKSHVDPEGSGERELLHCVWTAGLSLSSCVPGIQIVLVVQLLHLVFCWAKLPFVFPLC